MKTVRIKLVVNTVSPSSQPEGDRAIPRINVFKEPYTLLEGVSLLVDSDGVECEDITEPGEYNYKFELTEYERCGIDIFTFVSNTVDVQTDRRLKEDQYGTVVKRQISLHEDGDYTVTVNIT